MVSPSPAGTVDQELGRDIMSRDVTRDSETVILASDWSIPQYSLYSPLIGQHY